MNAERFSLGRCPNCDYILTLGINHLCDEIEYCENCEWSSDSIYIDSGWDPEEYIEDEW